MNNEYLFKSEGDKKVLQQLVSLYNEGFTAAQSYLSLVQLSFVTVCLIFFSCSADSGASLLEGVNPIDVGALVKCYLASIPEPLTTFSLYDELRAARVSIPDLRNILKKLPNVNYMTLEFVTALLLRVSRKSSLNKVDLVPYFCYFSLMHLQVVIPFLCSVFDNIVGTKSNKSELKYGTDC